MSNLSQNELNSSEKLDSKNIKESLDQNINYKNKNETTTCNLTKNAYIKEYMKRKRSTEETQVKQQNNEQMKKYMRSKQSNEDFQCKQKKNQYIKEYKGKKRATENSQQSTRSPQPKQKKYQYMKEYMKRKRATENSRQSTQSPQPKQKKNQYMKEYMKGKRSQSKNQTLQSLISKFHDIVSQGPHYICTCCDQLWYKHSVPPAATLKKTIPDIKKELLNRTSVDIVEWLC